MAPAFARSSEFAVDKPAGLPCPHLEGDDRCGIHAQLRVRGFAGCDAYDCFGAGQRVSRGIRGGRRPGAGAAQHWRAAPAAARDLFAAFGVVRQLHELLWYLEEAVGLVPPGELGDALRRARDAVQAASDGVADGTTAVAEVDVTGQRERTRSLLVQASALLRGAGADLAGADLGGADLAGAHLRGMNLAGSCLRGAALMGADLRGAQLHRTDLLGVDLRGARLEGADLRTALFVTQTQVGSASGDARTGLPGRL
ncbi:MAG: pentapeptide repeat-containing protein, partial [Actinomycetota bacterium]|nr:pentapeptide repeat-containing protein [Actinomycetota bacterium]